MTAARRPVKRAYESPYRAELAAQTRLRILQAAAQMFSEKGYDATTVDDVAAAAGVSRPTVFTAVGNKGRLIEQARDVALAGDDEPVPMPDRPWVHALRAEPDASKALRIYARALGEIYQRAARLELAISAAGDPEVKELAKVSRRQRYFGCNMIVGLLVAKRRLRPGLSRDTAVDLVFATASPEMFDLLVSERSWSLDRYRKWLAQTLEIQLHGYGPG
jgi:AcrR family transcriptional regulator